MGVIDISIGFLKQDEKLFRVLWCTEISDGLSWMEKKG